MSRERMTRRGAESRTILAEIERLERSIQAEDEAEEKKEEGMEDEPAKVEGADADEELAEKAEEIGQEDDDEMEAPAEAGMDQNERAMKNWPMKASEKHAVAVRLVALAKALIG